MDAADGTEEAKLNDESNKSRGDGPCSRTGNDRTHDQHLRVDNEAKLVKMDLSRCAADKMLAEICEAAGINLKEVAAVFAGPPCETYSPADACNISRGNEYRNHADANKGPRGWSTVHCEADKLKRERAILHDNMITNMMVPKRNFVNKLVVAK